MEDRASEDLRKQKLGEVSRDDENIGTKKLIESNVRIDAVVDTAAFRRQIVGLGPHHSITKQQTAGFGKAAHGGDEMQDGILRSARWKAIQTIISSRDLNASLGSRSSPVVAALALYRENQLKCIILQNRHFSRYQSKDS